MSVLRIFQWVLQTSLISVFVVGIILLCKLLFKEKLGVRWHYALWFLLIARLLIPVLPSSQFSVFNLFGLQSTPISQFSNLQFNIHQPKQTTEQRTIPDLQINSNTLPQDNSPSLLPNIYRLTRYQSNQNLALLLWIIGILSIGGYAGVSNLRFWRGLRKNSTAADYQTRQILEHVREKMNISFQIPAFYTSQIHSPTLYGYISPRILLPMDIHQQLTPQQLEYAIFHELAHLKRHDIAVNWVLLLLQIIHWFNPLVWIAFYWMRQDREIACDALALSHLEPEDNKRYGEMLITLLKNYTKRGYLCTGASVLESKHYMRRRITMIKNFMKSSRRGSLIGSISMVVIGFFILTNAVGCSNATQAVTKTEEAVLSEYIESYPFNPQDFEIIKAIKSKEQYYVVESLNPELSKSLLKSVKGPEEPIYWTRLEVINKDVKKELYSTHIADIFIPENYSGIYSKGIYAGNIGQFIIAGKIVPTRTETQASTIILERVDGEEIQGEVSKEGIFLVSFEAKTQTPLFIGEEIKKITALNDHGVIVATEKYFPPQE